MEAIQCCRSGKDENFYTVKTPGDTWESQNAQFTRSQFVTMCCKIYPAHLGINRCPNFRLVEAAISALISCNEVPLREFQILKC